MNVPAAVAAAITVSSMGYCALCIWAARRYASESKFSRVEGLDLLPVSILKPLKGTDPEMYESFRSHCVQDYPSYEILFGVTDANDPGAALVESLKQEFPRQSIRLVLCEKNLGANGKVSSLVQLAAAAKFDTLLVNDSDIRVAPDYLRTVITELQLPNTALVTCLYRGIPANTLASRLESLGISTDFVPGVLAAEQVERGLHFGLGSTLAFRRKELEAIGGFESIVDYLADDYELGKRIADRGLKVVLSNAVVETFLPAYSFAGFLMHQLRWARTIRVSRPGGYAGLLLTYTLPWALLCLVLARGATWAWALLGVAVMLRITMAWATAVSAVNDKRAMRWFWLLPVRDFLAPIVWIAGMFGNKIVWRGHEFELDKGKLKRVK
ncbi:MAG TPA: bacteriohopanetetrol glucosamine biosynthesis glycosyltransferase HpnI [Terriglobales bacterium]|nr:bacteriohopanetetrol glucosamine biosynthesis glycosyltransferase HpnI [Terriglobales bacterium]